MQSNNLRAALAASAVLATALPAIGQEPPKSVAALPVRQVTLYSSGVAYTERRGEVDGDAAVPLLFRIGQINDILKSMVLLDATGRVQPATYTARDPIGHTLQSFAIDVTGAMSQQQILTQLRGARVAVDSPGKAAVTGQIVSVEQREVPIADGKSITATFLNLFTEGAGGKEGGLTSLRLDGDTVVRFLDDRLNREFRSALGLLATGTDDQRRQVMLNFSGAGRREVRVGYVMEAPIWKMSYRLLVGGAAPERAGGRSYLQGWAMVENTSDEDWSGVKLSLVSGRPISFIEDLYQPLYIPRPEVGPDIVASPLPQTHDSGLEPGNLPGRLASQLNRQGISNGKAGFGAAGKMPQGPAGARGEAGPPGATAPADKEAQLHITTPVTLPRQQAALIPVIAHDVEAEKLLLFNADSGSRFPMNAVRLHNGTGLHLKGGPVTLFDDGVYAGDARMEDVPPNDTRLLSYAVDLSMEGERQGPANTSVDVSTSLRRGVLVVGRRVRIETTYTLRSKSDRARTVVVEHPFQSEYKLIAPETPLERTASLYRFSVPVPAGQSRTLKVVVDSAKAAGSGAAGGSSQPGAGGAVDQYRSGSHSEEHELARQGVRAL
jgi:hypothetical protein